MAMKGEQSLELLDKNKNRLPLHADEAEKKEHGMNSSFVVELGIYVLLWYSCSAVSNTASRKVLSVIPLPLYYTLAQFIFATFLSYIVIFVLKFKPYYKLPANGMNDFYKLTACYTIGFIMVNAGYVMVTVSLAETLRSVEPLVTVLLAYFWLKDEPVTTRTWLSLIPIVFGGALSSIGDSSFNLSGLLFVAISNLCFSLRSLYTKHLKKVYRGDAINIFFHISLYGTGAILGLIALSEAFVQIALTPNLSIFSKLELISSDIASTTFFGVIGYAMYNQMSFLVLSKVEMVTHGVGNAFRRVVTILVSVWYFGNEINNINALGIAMAISGVVLYSIGKQQGK